MIRISRIDTAIVCIIVLNAIGWATFVHVRSNQVRGTQPPSLALASALLLKGPTSDLKGNPSAPFTLVEFADYECPPCQGANPKIAKLLGKHAGTLNLCFRNYPLPMHKSAKPAAIFAERFRNTSKFWEVHDSIFNSGGKLDTSETKSLVTSIDKKKLTNEVIAMNKIGADMKLGESVHLDHTPSFYLCTPGEKVFEVNDLSQVEDLIRNLK